MNRYLSRLNLQPMELRLIVGIGVVLFIVVNLWLVWPHFNDWGKTNAELGAARAKLANYKKEIDPVRLSEYKSRLRLLEGEGSRVVAAEQSLDLIRTIQNQAIQSGVNVPSSSEIATSSSRTNEFFDEKARRITVVTGEKELVEFLVALGSSNSMIRARSMHLRRDATQTKLQGDLDLVASYQKNRPAKVEPPKTAAIVAPVPAKTPTPAPAKKNEPAKRAEPPSIVAPPKKVEPPRTAPAIPGKSLPAPKPGSPATTQPVNKK